MRISKSEHEYHGTNESAADLCTRVPITAVARALGLPVRRGRTVATWRNGEHYSVSLCDVKHCWHDHATGDGGGVLALIERARGCDRQDALKWLADFAGVPLVERTWTASEWRDWGRRRRDDERDGRDSEDYYLALARGLERDLEQHKQALLSAWDQGDAGEPLAEWIGARVGRLTRALGLIGRADDRARLLAYRAARLGQPEATARLLAAGRRQRERDEVFIARIVRAMAHREAAA